jgi:hypothetical protein
MKNIIYLYSSESLKITITKKIGFKFVIFNTVDDAKMITLWFFHIALFWTNSKKIKEVINK